MVHPLELFGIIIFFGTFGAYYVTLFMSLHFNEFKTKKEFLYALIPYQRWVMHFVNKFRKLQ